MNQKDKEIEFCRIEDLKNNLNYALKEGLISEELADELMKNPDLAERWLDSESIEDN